MCDKTLLIIDDNSAMLSATESALQGIYNVAAANTGRKGLEAFKTCKPNAVILDLHLPDINGLNLLPLLKSINASVPVIILTAVDDTSIASKALRDGAFTYLVKPMELRSLLSVIREATDRSPVADGIILPSLTTKNLFTWISQAYDTENVIALIGEKGVGKKSFARAVHRLYHGSEHQFLTIDSLSPNLEAILSEAKNKYLTVCVQTSLTQCLKLPENSITARPNCKILAAVETPILSQHQTAQVQDALSKSLKAFVIPPLRERKEESFPLLSYWHQRLAPEKVLNGEIAEFYLEKLDASSFAGNVTTIVDLARQLAQGKVG